MRTSATQFEVLVNFMEENGDINNISRCANGRVKNQRNWEIVSTLLNADPTGESRTVEKWKKVWSDLKSNSKKKGARLVRAASGTGGGPALHAKLTELEQRVLRIMGPQAATGLQGVVEAGLTQLDSDRTATLPPTPPPAATANSPTLFTEEIEIEYDVLAVDALQPTPNPLLSPTTHAAHTPRRRGSSSSQPRRLIRSPRGVTYQGAIPSPRGGAPCRRMLRSPRRRTRRAPTYVEQTAQEFLRSEELHRAILLENGRREDERLRLKAIELENEQKWQELFALGIVALNRFIDKI